MSFSEGRVEGSWESWESQGGSSVSPLGRSFGFPIQYYCGAETGHGQAGRRHAEGPGTYLCCTGGEPAPASQRGGTWSLGKMGGAPTEAGRQDYHLGQ